MTKIKWASLGLPSGASWNPIRARNAKTGKTGWHCEKVSPACEHCYAERLNMKAGDTGGAGLPYKPGHRQNGDIEVYLDEKTLLAPLHWKSPRGIFVCSMTDLFGDWVPDEWIDNIFAVMALCPQHRFAVLTKRPKRMLEYCRDVAGATARIFHCADEIAFARQLPETHPADQYLRKGPDANPWPLQNLWLGTTVERQQEADERIPDLLATPAAVRFVSIEPMLGPVDMKNIKPADRYELDALLGFDYETNLPCERIDWVICGGESGHGARPMHAAWARTLRDQCKALGVPFFFKQWGEWGTSAYLVSSGQPVFRVFDTFDQWVNKASTWIAGGICLDRHGRNLKIGADFMRARDESAFPVTIRTGGADGARSDVNL